MTIMASNASRAQFHPEEDSKFSLLQLLRAMGLLRWLPALASIRVHLKAIMFQD